MPINDPGHMTKMTAMHIYGKILKTSSSSEPDVIMYDRQIWHGSSENQALRSLYMFK